MSETVQITDRVNLANDLLGRLWRELRNDCSEDRRAHFAGAVDMARWTNVLKDDDVELWMRRIETCPGHEDEGRRSWCAYGCELPTKGGSDGGNG